MVNRERANLDRLASALRELHARLRVAHMSDEVAQTLPVVVDGVMLETTGSSTWTTDAGPFDVMADLKDVRGATVPYHELLSRSLVVQGEGFVVHVASVDDIIAAKTFANREKDREALPELLEIQARELSASAEIESAPRTVGSPKYVDSERSTADVLNELREEREF